MTQKTGKNSTKSVKTLPAKTVKRRDAEAVRGGTRDVASGLRTGKRMH